MLRKTLSLLAFAFGLVLLFSACARPNQQPVPVLEEGEIIDAALGGAGLTGDYFDNIDFTGTKVTRVDPNINKSWGTARPIAGIAATTYSVRWTGQIVPAFSEEYTFYVTSAGAARLMVNGIVLTNNWTDHAQTVDSGKITLTAGVKYDIQLEFKRETATPAVIKLEWESARRLRQVVPKDRHFPVGSNLEQAKCALEQYSDQLAGIDLDLNAAIGSLTNEGYSLIVKERNASNFISTTVSLPDCVINVIIKIGNVGGNIDVTNVANGKSANIGPLSNHVNPDGSSSQQQIDNLARYLAPVMLDNLTSLEPDSLCPGCNDEFAELVLQAGRFATAVIPQLKLVDEILNYVEAGECVLDLVEGRWETCVKFGIGLTPFYGIGLSVLELNEAYDAWEQCKQDRVTNCIEIAVLVSARTVNQDGSLGCYLGNGLNNTCHLQSGQKALLEARVYNSQTGQNITNQEVTWTASGGGSITKQNGKTYYKSPVRNPTPGREVNITATSVADTSKSGSVLVGIDAIRLSVYEYLTLNRQAVVSGAKVPLTIQLANDFTHPECYFDNVRYVFIVATTCVKIEVTKGKGSIVFENGIAYYVADAQNPSGETAVEITVSSIADPNKKVKTTGRVEGLDIEVRVIGQPLTDVFVNPSSYHVSQGTESGVEAIIDGASRELIDQGATLTKIGRGSVRYEGQGQGPYDWWYFTWYYKPPRLPCETGTTYVATLTFTSNADPTKSWTVKLYSSGVRCP